MTRGARPKKTPLDFFDRSRVVGSVAPQQVHLVGSQTPQARRQRFAYCGLIGEIP